jgi:hypothetical protein
MEFKKLILLTDIFLEFTDFLLPKQRKKIIFEQKIFIIKV